MDHKLASDPLAIKYAIEKLNEIYEAGNISKVYLHREYVHGVIQLNIEFNDLAGHDFDTEQIREIDYCAYWE